MTSYIYLIQATESKRLKIGIADNPTRRLATLQTGSPEPLILLEAIKMPGDKAYARQAAKRLEKTLHSRFDPFHLHGEWFRNVQPITDNFKKIQQGRAWMGEESA